MVEQGIRDNGSLMKMDAWIVRVHPDRWSGGDEVNVMSTRSQFLAQLGGDDAGAAVCGIAGDANAHSGPQSKDRASNQIKRLACGRASPDARVARTAKGSSCQRHRTP